VTNKTEQRNYAIAYAAATGNRVIWEDKDYREIVCDTCNGCGMHNGIPCAPCNARGYTNQSKKAPTAASKFKVR
jgi:DnaJ-class molecular chaperone